MKLFLKILLFCFIGFLFEMATDKEFNDFITNHVFGSKKEKSKITQEQIKEVKNNITTLVDQVTDQGDIKTRWSTSGDSIINLPNGLENIAYMLSEKTEDRSTFISIFNYKLSDLVIQEDKQLHLGTSKKNQIVKDNWVPALSLFSFDTSIKSIGYVLLIFEDYVAQHNNAVCTVSTPVIHYVTDKNISSETQSYIELLIEGLEKLPLLCDVPMQVNGGYFKLKSFFPDGSEDREPGSPDLFSYHKQPITSEKIWTHIFSYK